MHSKLFIDGEWIAASNGAMLDVINPANEEVFHQVAAGTTFDINAAVKAARRAFDKDPWPRMSGAKRAEILNKIADTIEQRTAQLAHLEVLDNGKPLAEAVWDMEDSAGCFRFFAGMAESVDNEPDEQIELDEPRFKTRVVKEPVGVAVAIIPWNYPLLMAAWKVAPALAAGCTMVLKPSELTPLTALELADICHSAGLPNGVLNVVTGLGPDAGQPLSEHPDIDKIAFTGSVPTGTKVMQAAALNIKNISLELGGKSPFVIFADSDIEKAVEWVMFGIFWNQGEVCSATSRVLVERAFYEPFLARIVEEARKITIGNGLDDGVLLGPLVSRDQQEKVLAAIKRGKEEGARILTGGGVPAQNSKGYFVEPTIFTDMAKDSWIWQEEIFGPVVCIKPFDTEAEAIEMANDSRFGLAAAVMSADEERAERVANAFRAGIVWINCSQPTFVEAPWGGYKQSGIARELGRWGFDGYLETKQITRYISEEPWGWYLNG